MNIHDVLRPFMIYFRKKRLKHIYGVLKINSDSSVIDIGGSIFWWELASKNSLPVPTVTIVNLHPYEESHPLPNNFKWVVSDGCHLPFNDNEFDIGFSNSVIEHVGPWGKQEQFAAELQRVCKTFYVQTPDIQSPFEYHLHTFFIHWLPRHVQPKFFRYFTLWGWRARPSKEECEEMIHNDLFLLNRRQFSELFPNTQIHFEKFLGFPKSLYCFKTN